MYIEIGPRQTGKTTRMINAIKEYLEENTTTTVTIVGASYNNNALIAEKLIIAGVDIARVKMSYKMDVNNSTRYFVDLFDYIEPENLIIDESAYYCSDINYLKSEKGSEFTRNLLEYKYKMEAEKAEKFNEAKKFIYEPYKPTRKLYSTTDNILKEQIEELEKLLKLKNDRIAEMEKNNLNGFQPLKIEYTSGCIGGCEFPDVWFGIIPPKCKKCGQQAPNHNISF